MAIGINDISSGIGLILDNIIFLVVDYSHVKPGKGSAFVRVRLKNIKTDAVIERTFRSSERLDDVELAERRLQYLYRSGDSFHFMDHTSYEEAIVPKESLGDMDRFLLENLEVTGLAQGDKILKIILPNFIVAQIVSTEQGIKGDSTRSGGKPARIETGSNIQVPLFININEWVKIDTRTGEYVERVNK